jgi:hypothetical protein
VLEHLRSATRKYNQLVNDIEKLESLRVVGKLLFGKQSIPLISHDLLFLVQIFASALRQRRDTWNRIRGEIAATTKTDFLAHLAKRGFLGAVTFDHENSTLSLKVS